MSCTIVKSFSVKHLVTKKHGMTEEFHLENFQITLGDHVPLEYYSRSNLLLLFLINVKLYLNKKNCLQ